MTSILPELRAQIDSVDEELLSLLERRARIAGEIAAAKQQEGRTEFYDPAREREVIERLAGKAGLPLSPVAVRAVFREVVSACLSVQKPLQVAYLGPAGTFSSVAARKLFGDAALYREIGHIDAVFDAVARGSTSRGVVPLENSTEGAVATTMRALIDRDVQVERELTLDVRHALLSRHDTLGAIARVYSHPQALAQCGRWLSTNLPAAQLVPTSSTAAAMQEAISDASAAAIGLAESGQQLGLKALADSIQDRADNQTRFIVLSPTDGKRTGNDGTMIAFALTDGPGALRRALAPFEEHNVNLTRLASFPTGNRAWDYFFFCELRGHRTDEPLTHALELLRKQTEWVKVLGSFPLAT